MTIDDLPKYDDEESETYQVPTEYPIEYCGCFASPVYQVVPEVPEEYLRDAGSHKDGLKMWVKEDDPLMGPEMFKMFWREEAKQIFTGERDLRSQAVVKSAKLPGERDSVPDGVELGYKYLVSLYQRTTHFEDGDQVYRRIEAISENALDRWERKVREVFEDTPYGVLDYTVVPHEAGTPPLDEKYERY